MDALETLLQPVVGLVNRQIRSTTPARELCGELEGRVVAVGVRNTALSIYVRVEAERIALTGTYDAEPDVVISGSPISLAMLAGPDGETAIRDGSVSLAGDAELAAKFQRLLRYGRPDLEEELSRFTGDVAAHDAAVVDVRKVDRRRVPRARQVGRAAVGLQAAGHGHERAQFQALGLSLGCRSGSHRNGDQRDTGHA